jgi:hypothetical protein
MLKIFQSLGRIISITDHCTQHIRTIYTIRTTHLSGILFILTYFSFRLYASFHVFTSHLRIRALFQSITQHLSQGYCYESIQYISNCS